jgi:hypothetical protein
VVTCGLPVLSPVALADLGQGKIDAVKYSSRLRQELPPRPAFAASGSCRGHRGGGALYLRYGLSYRDVEELLFERGIDVDHVTVYR